MSLPVAPAQKKKLPWLKLAAVAIVLLAGAVLMLRGVDVRGLINKVMEEIRSRGPLAFFTGMAILPAVGFPVLAFVLTAGPAFSEQLGTPTVVAFALLAVTVNFLITYGLARGALRPFLEKLLTRFGYEMPNVEVGDATDLVVIMRLTPGVPFFVQNYMAGLAGLPFGKYLFISCLIVWPYNATTVLFGDAVMKGKGGLALLAFSLLVVAAATTHLVRRHYARKTKPVA
ncbi:MAG TPA: VTT domain-containing protein [Opitutaceae bacterium]|nr:VTT domain-containing protein [Opitutaceae bacterium]